MSLDPSKLEKVVELGNGVKRARCPACAEGGHDKAGEHLRIYPDGRFGCCVYPKDPEHRKRIYALTGERSRRSIKVRVVAVKVAAPIESSILGKISGLFSTPARDAWDGVTEVGNAGTLGTGESNCQQNGTAGTGVSESKAEIVEELPFAIDAFGTLGTTPLLSSRVRTREEDSVYKLKGWKSPRPKRPNSESGSATLKKECLPFLTADGSLSIPFSSPERYHWWKDGGQSVEETLKEVRAGLANKERSKCADEY